MLASLSLKWCSGYQSRISTKLNWCMIMMLTSLSLQLCSGYQYCISTNIKLPKKQRTKIGKNQSNANEKLTLVVTWQRWLFSVQLQLNSMTDVLWLFCIYVHVPIYHSLIYISVVTYIFFNTFPALVQLYFIPTAAIFIAHCAFKVKYWNNRLVADRDIN